MEGKSILTVEGLSDFEKEAYTYGFGEAGAVQCGFCIPGMVMAAKGLLDGNPDPTVEEIRFALRTNICRCTGYVKIIEGVRLTAKILREGRIPDEEEGRSWKLGSRVHRIDVAEKVQGTGIYPDDIYMEGMICASAVRSAHPRALVKAIRTEKAKALPGVVGVFTAADIPGQNKVGHLVKDWDTMIAVGSTTHYLGDAICIVAAETQEILEEAKQPVEGEDEVLEPVRSPQAATLAVEAPGAAVKGVSPARAKALGALGMATVRDLVCHFHRRYIDLSVVCTVADARIGSSCTICGTVHEVKLKRPKPRLSLTEITLTDATGTLMVTCFRQPWQIGRAHV